MADFYLDEDVPEALAVLLAGHGHSAVTTRTAGRKGTPDFAQLWHATLGSRLFVTLNRKDYLLLHGAWQLWGVTRRHPGIVIAPHVPRGDLPMLTADIDILVRSALGVSGNAVYQWTATGWR